MATSEAPIREAFSYRTDPAVPEFSDDRPILIFDGVCVLCSRSVNFVLRHDKRDRFRLLAAQTPIGQAIYKHYSLNPTDFETIILLFGGKPWLKSESVIQTAMLLGFPWSCARILRIFPRALRDRVYEWIARNRFRIFGRRETCYLPTAETRARFLQ
jgi:predicted DCC family thiol-disulfide oxidoreductase YuxK